MKLLYCAVYMAVLGVLAFPAGRLYAKIPFNSDAFPFREYAFEREKKIYSRLRVRKWQKLVPDVSRMFPQIVPRKAMDGVCSTEKLRIMIRETCVSEMMHVTLSLLGLVMLRLWRGAGGRIVYAVYVLLGNVPYIIVQRYNRPRLKRLLSAEERKENRLKHENTDSQL